MKLRVSRTSIAMERRLRSAVIVLEAIDRLAETAAGAVDGRAAAGVIADVAVAVDGPVVADGIADVVGLVGDDTKSYCHGSSRIHTDTTRKATMGVVAFHSCAFGVPCWTCGRFAHAGAC